MQFKTHLAIGVFAALLFFPVVNNPVIFSIMVLVASAFPDIDTPFSRLGKYKFAKMTQVFTEHRGFIHSLTFCLVVSFALALFLPSLAFGFFLGYSLHLVADGFTKSGIAPFWPYSRTARGFVRTGSLIDKGLFVGFVIIDLGLAGTRLFGNM